MSVQSLKPGESNCMWCDCRIWHEGYSYGCVHENIGFFGFGSRPPDCYESQSDRDINEIKEIAKRLEKLIIQEQ